jgi:hypothetical protein
MFKHISATRKRRQCDQNNLRYYSKIPPIGKTKTGRHTLFEIRLPIKNPNLKAGVLGIKTLAMTMFMRQLR